MKLIFTKFVRSLAEGKKPTDEEVKAVLRELRRLLQRKMKKRLLWSGPPRYLGVRGWSSWSEEEAFEELLQDCYVFNFIDRLPSLQGFLGLNPNIEGLVHLNVGNFLFERQKMFDPVGYRTFQILQSAVLESIRAKEIYVLAGDSRIRNSTVLGFYPDADSSPGDQARALAEATESWSDELFPGLVTARGKEKDAVIDKLRGLVLSLRDQGFDSFVFGDLISPLKEGVRQRWRALSLYFQGDMEFEDDDEDGGKKVKLVEPDSAFEDAQVLVELSACVEDAIDDWGNRVKTRSDLRKLWDFLLALVAEDEPIPSNRKISELLEIPRSSVPKRFSILGQLLENCRMGEE